MQHREIESNLDLTDGTMILHFVQWEIFDQEMMESSKQIQNLSPLEACP
jgi:hypothetical protein